MVAVAWFTNAVQVDTSDNPAATQIWGLYGTGCGMAVGATCAGLGLLVSKLGRHYIKQGKLDMDMDDATEHPGSISAAGVFMSTWGFHCVVFTLSACSSLVLALLPFFPSQVRSFLFKRSCLQN